MLTHGLKVIFCSLKSLSDFAVSPRVVVAVDNDSVDNDAVVEGNVVVVVVVAVVVVLDFSMSRSWVFDEELLKREDKFVLKTFKKQNLSKNSRLIRTSQYFMTKDVPPDSLSDLQCVF